MGRRSSDVVQEIRFGMTGPMKALLDEHMEVKKIQAFGTSAAAIVSSGGLILAGAGVIWYLARGLVAKASEVVEDGWKQYSDLKGVHAEMQARAPDLKARHRAARARERNFCEPGPNFDSALCESAKAEVASIRKESDELQAAMAAEMGETAQWKESVPWWMGGGLI